MLPRLLRILRTEYTARVVGEADGGDLMPIRVGVEAKAVGDSQSSAPEGGQVCCFRTETRRVRGFLAVQWDEEAAGTPNLQLPTPKGILAVGSWELGVGTAHFTWSP